MRVVLTGSSGFIGSHLHDWLTSQQDEVIRLVRDKNAVVEGRTAYWNPAEAVVPTDVLEGADAVVHLGGENIADGPWNEEKKKRIRDSRVVSTRVLSEALAGLSTPPKVFISAGATGFYGNRGDERVDEDAAPGQGFLAEVCQAWEAATQPAKEQGIRVINLRIGMVISPDGGALKKLMPLFRWGLGGVLGPGTQYMSWIVLADLLRIITWCIEKETLSGPVNAVTPWPVTNREFTKYLAKTLHRPAWFRVPAFVLRRTLGEMADEMLLSSTRVFPKRLIETRFTWLFPELFPALRYLTR